MVAGDGFEPQRAARETVVSVVIPTEMLALFAGHVRTGIPPAAQSFRHWDEGEPSLKGH